MQVDTRLGTFEQSFAGADPEIAAIGRAVRALVEELHPDAVEVARPGEHSVAWGVGPRKMSEAYAYVIPYADSLNLGFFHAAWLPDPDGLLCGTGASMRHVKLRTLDDLANPAVRALVEAAIAERRAALGR